MNIRTRNRAIYTFFCLFAGIALTPACQDEQQMKFEHYYANGRRLYAQHCQNCHAADGRGLGQLIPPLTDTLFLKENRNQLACIVKNGLNGKITINGKEYSGEMPANPALAPIDLAQLVTYITNSFGNKQGPYTVDQVQEDCK